LEDYLFRAHGAFLYHELEELLLAWEVYGAGGHFIWEFWIAVRAASILYSARIATEGLSSTEYLIMQAAQRCVLISVRAPSVHVLCSLIMRMQQMQRSTSNRLKSHALLGLSCLNTPAMSFAAFITRKPSVFVHYGNPALAYPARLSPHGFK